MSSVNPEHRPPCVMAEGPNQIEVGVPTSPYIVREAGLQVGLREKY
jgi:hypothetical protein